MTAAPTPKIAEAEAAFFDPHSDEHVSSLGRMFTDYLLEDLERLGHFPPGIPLANWLWTLMVYVDGRPAGFCSIDYKRCSVELVYIAPAYRRFGLARRLLGDIRDSCPKALALKAPVSPGGQALADSLGLPLSVPTESEIAAAQRTLDDLHQSIRERCRHKQTGDPRRPCMRCYRTALKRSAAAMITTPCYAIRAASALNIAL
jgi:GNAT superfamily N-acetyltransferase